MEQDPGRRRPHPRSPVQPGGSNAWYFIAALFAAIAIWTFQQIRIQDSSPAPAGADTHQGGSSAKGDLRRLFSASDYPAKAQARGEQGRVMAELEIDTHGRVSKCNIVESSGHPSLDETTCRILQRRARFTPARDVDGKPVPDRVTTPAIVWRLEG